MAKTASLTPTTDGRGFWAFLRAFASPIALGDAPQCDGPKTRESHGDDQRTVLEVMSMPIGVVTLNEKYAGTITSIDNSCINRLVIPVV
jgi:hypothetical protein